ncbi:hypothetical protein D3C74_442860 [compost metagenome]
MTYGGIRLADKYIRNLIGIIDLPAAIKVFGNHNQPRIRKLFNGFADRAYGNYTS